MNNTASGNEPPPLPPTLEQIRAWAVTVANASNAINQVRRESQEFQVMAWGTEPALLLSEAEVIIQRWFEVLEHELEFEISPMLDNPGVK